MMKSWNKQRRSGFTIVELLIVIVVIAILAAITVVAYTGITNRANDTAVQSDLSQLAKQFDAYRVINNTYPTSGAEFTSIGLRASTQSYGQNVRSGADEYNLLYCRPQSGNPDRYALLASSKSGTLFRYIDGTITTISRTEWDTEAIPSATLCSSAGIPTSSAQVWFYYQNTWRWVT